MRAFAYQFSGTEGGGGGGKQKIKELRFQVTKGGYAAY
jgi:hypothetical protein